MIGQRLKTKQLKIYDSECNEIESFSLLRLNAVECKMLFDTTANWTQEGEALVTEYKTDDKTDMIWKVLATRHKRSNPEFKDVSKDYKLDIEGTSCLIRDPEKHIIRIAYRRELSTWDINKLPITNDVREKFFKDAKQSECFKTTKKYAIDQANADTYKMWSDYMNNKYLENIKS